MNLQKFPAKNINTERVNTVSVVAPFDNSKAGIFIMGKIKTWKCNKCGVKYLFTEEFFRKDKRDIGGLRKTCKKNIIKIIIALKNLKKEKIKKYHKEYTKTNKEKINLWFKNKKQTDVNFKLRANLSSRISMAIKKNSKIKKNTIKLLGCDIPFLKRHLEKQFTKKMTWQNYGSYWHIDHTVPCCKFDLTKESEQKQCFNYRNLQPLEAKKKFK